MVAVLCPWSSRMQPHSRNAAPSNSRRLLSARRSSIGDALRKVTPLSWRSRSTREPSNSTAESDARTSSARGSLWTLDVALQAVDILLLIFVIVLGVWSGFVVDATAKAA